MAEVPVRSGGAAPTRSEPDMESRPAPPSPVGSPSPSGPAATQFRPSQSADDDERDHRLEPRPVRVAVVASDHWWRRQFAAYVTEHEARIDLHMLRDPAMLHIGSWDLVLVDDTVSFLGLIGQSTPEGVCLIGIVVPDGAGAGAEAMSRHGISVHTGRTDRPADLAAMVLARAVGLGISPQSPHRLRARTADERTPARPSPSSTAPSPTGSAPTPAPPNSPVGVGRLTGLMTVGGPDSRLALETGIGFAVALSAWAQAVLIDLDPRRLLGPRLGLQLQPNVHDLASALARDHDVDPFAFFGRRQISNVALPFWSMVGPSVPGLPDALDAVESQVILTHLADHVPFQITLIGDVRGRDDSWVPAVDGASRVVAVTDPTPLGVTELLDWATTVADGAGPRPLFNIVFVGSTHGSRRARAEAELRASMPPAMIATVGHVTTDRRALDNHHWAGRVPSRRQIRRFDKALGPMISQDAAGGGGPLPSSLVPAADSSEVPPTDTPGDRSADSGVRIPVASSDSLAVGSVPGAGPVPAGTRRRGSDPSPAAVGP